MNYTYRGGDRPLEGFTIKCGVGRGAFGEVYVAESEGGKYVALKLLTANSDVELRGLAPCLNLKHPNLIHLYDLRTDDRGHKWVVMEYVLGDSLAKVLDRHPHGLPPHLAKEWFLSLARAVGYLHDKLVVHRDLKPGNVFLEDGQVKVGDFGLCKRIASGHREAQSQGVGTVYYMAPEIDRGQYTKSVDVYACGIILFEMLTGTVPFNGASPLEILHKHLTDAPDLSKVPAAFRPVLETALQKDPAKRFATMADFARAVEAVAVGPALAATVLPVAVPVTPVNLPVPPSVPHRPPAGPLPAEARGRLAELAGSLAAVPLMAALCTAPWALFQTTVEWPTLARLFLLTSALSGAAVLVGRLPAKRTAADTWGRRARMIPVGVAVGVLAFWLDGWGLPQKVAADADVPYREQYLGGAVRMTPESLSIGMRYVTYFALAAAAFRWWTITDRRRSERFRLWPVLAAGFWGGVLMFLWPRESNGVVGVVPLVLAAVTVQMVSPWVPPPPPPPRRVRLRLA